MTDDRLAALLDAVEEALQLDILPPAVHRRLDELLPAARRTLAGVTVNPRLTTPELGDAPLDALDEACIGDPSHQWHSHDDDPDDDPAPTPPDALREVVDRLVHRTPFLPAVGGITAHLSFLQMEEARAALATPSHVPHQPGEPHRYRTLCEICGGRGYLHVSLEPQFAPKDGAS